MRNYFEWYSVRPHNALGWGLEMERENMKERDYIKLRRKPK